MSRKCHTARAAHLLHQSELFRQCLRCVVRDLEHLHSARLDHVRFSVHVTSEFDGWNGQARIALDLHWFVGQVQRCLEGLPLKHTINVQD